MMIVSRALICLASLALLGLSAASPALGQIRSEPPLAEADGGLVLASGAHELWLPAPDWLDAGARQSGAIKPLVDAVYRSGEAQALLEIRPKGEGEALWHTQFGARLTMGTTFSLPAFREAVVSGFASNCDASRTAIFQLGADSGETLAPLGLVCGSYSQSMSAFAGEGEIMVVSFRKADDVVAIVFQQWRGDAFMPSDTTTWPVPSAQVEARARQLQAEVRLTQAD